MTLSIIVLSDIMLSVFMLSVFMLNVVMLNVVMLNVVMLNVVMISVVAGLSSTKNVTKIISLTFVKQAYIELSMSFYPTNLPLFDWLFLNNQSEKSI